jgi:hypothetical protein
VPETPAGTGAGPRIERTVLPDTETLISVQTAPEAVCFLYYDNAERRMQLDADNQGIVRFHIKAPKNAQPIELRLEYSDRAGTTTVHTLAISSDPHHLLAEETATVNGYLSSGREVRPALEGDLQAVPDQELVPRGYPPRPDPVKTPARYARWQRLVCRPYAIVDPRKVPHPDVSFQQQNLPPKLRSPTLPLPPPIVRSIFNNNSNTWSGAYYTNPAGQFASIEADWMVPRVGNPGGPLYSAAAVWVGLDNNKNDLFQTGTDSECWILPEWLGGGNWIITNYWMWIESVPFAPWAVPDFPVSPRDIISVDMFVADQYGNTWYQDGSNGGLTPADNSIWFMLYNNSQNASYWGTLPTAPVTIDGTSDAGFTGATAEFILERPSDLSTNNPYPLADFGIAAIYDCWYADALYGLGSPFQLGDNGSEPFDGNLAYINMVGASGDLLALPLSIPDLSNPGSYRIVWIWVNYQ